MHDSIAANLQGGLEKPEDAGKGEPGEVSRWLMELDLASKVEKDWRAASKRTIDRYRDEKERNDWQFNILWANTEVLRPQLYNSTPKADVRRRFRDADKVGKIAAEILERALDYSLDSYDFDSVMETIVLDYVLPGRAVARVRFEPSFETQGKGEEAYETMVYARCRLERVPWDRFRRGPGISWDEIPWIAYEHQLTNDEVEAKFQNFGGKVNYDVTMEGVDADRADAEPSVFKRVRIWEIWDKQKKQILFLAPTYKDGFLKREEDKLNLEGFFDCERPLYSVESGNSLVPQCEYEMYRDQAKELDLVTMRINKLVRALKLRGIYDSTIAEFKELFKAADNEMVPTDSATAAMAAGGLDKAIWMMPIEEASKVLKELLMHRDGLKQTIYEITGLSDILRGSTDPNETLGAQKLKAQTGSLRLQRRQRDIQRFIRGLLRKKAEIIAENYTPELLSLMTGIQLPRQAEKEAAQQQLAMQQQVAQFSTMAPQGPQEAQTPLPPAPPPPDPQMIAMLQMPSWEEVMAVLKSDLLRGFRVDIETDSTIAADQQSEREEVTELVQGLGAFITNIGPAVENGAMSMDVAKKIMLSCIRRFKFGREVEDAIEQDSMTPQQQRPDPSMLKLQADVEQTKVENQMDMEKMKADYEFKHKELVANHELELQKMQMERDVDLKKHQMKLQVDDANNMRMAEATSKPTTQVQFNADEAVNQVAMGIQQMAAQVAQDHAQQMTSVQQLLGVVAESSSAIANALATQQESGAAQVVALQQIASSNAEAMQALAKAIEQQAAVAAAPRVAVRDSSGRISEARIKMN